MASNHTVIFPNGFLKRIDHDKIKKYFRAIIPSYISDYVFDLAHKLEEMRYIFNALKLKHSKLTVNTSVKCVLMK